MISWLLGTRIGRLLTAVAAFVGAVGLALLTGRWQGRREAGKDAKLKDARNADQIRKRAADARGNDGNAVDRLSKNDRDLRD